MRERLEDIDCELADWQAIQAEAIQVVLDSNEHIKRLTLLKKELGSTAVGQLDIESNPTDVHEIPNNHTDGTAAKVVGRARDEIYYFYDRRKKPHGDYPDDAA